MAEGQQVVRRGPSRAWHYVEEAFWAGAVSVWKSVNFFATLGLVGSWVAIIGGGIVLAAILNPAWIVAAGFALFFLIAVIGGYRVWSKTEHALSDARADLADAQEKLPGSKEIHYQQLNLYKQSHHGGVCGDLRGGRDVRTVNSCSCWRHRSRSDHLPK